MTIDIRGRHAARHGSDGHERTSRTPRDASAVHGVDPIGRAATAVVDVPEATDATAAPGTRNASAAPAPAGTTTELDRPAAGAHRAPAPAPRSGGRDRYIDSLRVLALVRVVAYHLFGWIWLPAVFPSMGVMFALAGSLMAVSLDRNSRHALRVIRKRMKRLLPPLWAFGLVVVPIMAVYGWTTPEDGTPLTWSTALAWVVPFVNPPTTTLGEDWTVPLWYICAYLWFVLLSPSLLWCYRRWPLRTLAVPLVTIAAIAYGVLEPSGSAGDVITDLATFGACWILGFAHHDGTIRRLPLWKVLVPAAVSMALGLAWAFGNPSEVGPDISDIPLADALFCFGFVLVLLRLYVDMSWVERVPLLDRAITAINRRAMTVYLWGNIAIAAALWGLDHVDATQRFTGEDPLSHLVAFVATWLVLGVCVMLVGWVEDVAAGRPLRRPFSRSTARAAA